MKDYDAPVYSQAYQKRGKNNMKVKTSKPTDGRVTLTITASSEDAAAGIAYLIAKCASENSVDPSEAPDLEFAVRAKVGGDYLQAYLDSQLPLHLAGRAIGQENLETMLNPELIGEPPHVSKGEAVSFTASVILNPRFELTSYDPVTVNILPITVSDVEIDEQMLMLADSFATYQEDADGNPDPATKVIPAITDTWVSENIPNTATVPELREMLYQNALKFKQMEQEEYIAYAASSELAKRLEGDIPAEILELTKNDLLSALKRNLDVQERSLEEFINSQGGPEVFSTQTTNQAYEVLRQGFALDALARHLDMQVTAEDVQDAFARMAPGHEDLAYMDFFQTGRMYVMEEAALRIKVNLWLVEHAIINQLE
ncbi:MAG: hypothetical protein LBU61_00290 [Coriobacteriales bacterium]|jgi:FKBP-type peptidyl-prolyl cis-trans isomerase (trigger factor)|nr:hypothetical protein [Coriobacteriales bacterium]